MMKSLEDKQIVITRAEHQAGELEALLRERGALPLLYPCISIVPPLDSAPLQTLAAFDWLVFTSANAVWALRDRPLPAHVEVAAVGEATARAVTEWLGVPPRIVPEHHDSAGLLTALSHLRGAHVLLPQSEIADVALYEGLVKAGASVTRVTAYRTVIGTGGVDLAGRQVDLVTFTSPSTVYYFIQRVQQEGGAFTPFTAACIGATTARIACDCGFRVAVVAQTSTSAGMVQAIEDYYRQEGVAATCSML